MVIVGVAIVGVLSPPGIGHPGDGADAQPLRSGAGSHPSWGRPGRTAPMACGQPRRARRGRPSGRGPAAVGRLARRASRPPARHLRFSVPPGDRGQEGATGVGACPASPPGREWVVSIKSRPLHRGLGSDSAPAHHLWSPRVSPNPPHTPIQRGAPTDSGGPGRTSSSSSTSRSAASPPASCTTHHHPRVPAT
jgi:hypothetical protein